MSDKAQRTDTDLALPARGFFSDPIGMGTTSGMLRKLLLMLGVNPTERGLCLGILDYPQDPERRLVYGDWLEEHGRLEEAACERAMAKQLEDLARQQKITGISLGAVVSGAIASGQVSPFLRVSGAVYQPATWTMPQIVSGYSTISVGAGGSTNVNSSGGQE